MSEIRNTIYEQQTQMMNGDTVVNEFGTSWDKIQNKPSSNVKPSQLVKEGGQAASGTPDSTTLFKGDGSWVTLESMLLALPEIQP